MPAATEIWLMVLSAGIAGAGIAAAYVSYVRRGGAPARRLAERLNTLYRVVSRKYYVDEAYNRYLVGGTLGLGRAAAWFDARIIDGLVDGAAALTRGVSSLSMLFDGRAIDGAVNGLGSVHRALSGALRRLQTGYVYNYALAVIFGILALITLVVTIF